MSLGDRTILKVPLPSSHALMNGHVCMCVCMYGHACMYVCACVYPCMKVCMYACVCICACVHVCIRIIMTHVYTYGITSDNKSFHFTIISWIRCFHDISINWISSTIYIIDSTYACAMIRVNNNVPRISMKNDSSKFYVTYMRSKCFIILININ